MCQPAPEQGDVADLERDDGATARIPKALLRRSSDAIVETLSLKGRAPR